MNTKNKILSLILCLALFVSCFVFAEPSTIAQAATRQELQDRIEEIDGEIAANKSKLDKLKDEAKSQKEYLETLETQIETVESKAITLQTQIGVIDEEISELGTQLKQLRKEIKLIEDEITEKQNEITQTEKDIAQSSDNLASRIRAAYINGNESTLKILMGSDSLASFMTRLEMMKRSSENDKKLINEFKDKAVKLKKKKASLEEDKKELDKKEAEVAEKKTEAQAKKDELSEKEKEYKKTTEELEAQYASIETYIEKLDKSSAAYKAYITELEKERKKADAEIDRILSMYYATSVKQTTTLQSGNNNDSNKPTATQQGAGPAYKGSGSWYWPLGNASCYISSHYGNRSASISGWSFHGGTDIAGGGISGKPVYASRAGTVITAVTSNSGYGIYVLIDHGDGFSTLYAHMSARYVSTGDSVTQGQMIGRVGSTGNSTGPHLHFEVRYYGEKKNPMNYVKKP